MWLPLPRETSPCCLVHCIATCNRFTIHWLVFVSLSTHPPVDGSYCEHGREIFDEEAEASAKDKKKGKAKKPVSLLLMGVGWGGERDRQEAHSILVMDLPPCINRLMIPLPHPKVLLFSHLSPNSYPGYS